MQGVVEYLEDGFIRVLSQPKQHDYRFAALW